MPWVHDEYRAVLNEFKAKERPESAASISSNKSLMKILSVWHLVDYEWGEPKSPAPVGDMTRWLWLWDEWGYDSDELSRSTGLDIRAVKKTVQQAIRARLVYPDGTLSKAASGAVNGAVAKQAEPAFRLQKNLKSESQKT